jgi:protein-glucosylgalactosylhydroxylysine glucosidase
MKLLVSGLLALPLLGTLASGQPASWLPRIAASNFLYAKDDATVNQNALPILANGFLATQFMSNSVYASLIYNGYLTEGPSHAARIPASLAVSIQGATPCDGGLDLANATFYRRSYIDPSPAGSCTLDSTVTCSNAASRVYVEQRFYAHRLLSSVLVNEVEILTSDTVERDYGIRAAPSTHAGSNDPLVMLQLTNNYCESNCVEDITFGAIALPDSFPFWILNGSTNIAETNTSGLQAVTVLASWLGSPNSSDHSSLLAIYGAGQTTVHLNVIRTSVETNSSDLISAVIDDFNNAVLYVNNGTLLSSHIQEWQEMVWTSGIEIGGRPDVAVVANSSLFGIVSAIRTDRHGGISPSGLTSGYNGHKFWDMETWMEPTVRLLYPDLASSLIQYRFERMDGARQKALSYSPPFSGTMWPWESAYTGVETCPTWAATGLREIHISGDIPMALYDYWRSIDDNGNGWLTSVGWPILEGTATFWMSKLMIDNPNNYNSQGPLSLNNVIPPDEYQDHRNNSAWTNLGAILTLRYAAAAAQELGKPPSVWEPWLDAASRIVMLYNTTSPSGAAGGFHPEYANYNATASVKQADVVLIPLVKSLQELQAQLATQNASFTATTVANDLDWYATVTDPDGPAMTWGVFAGGYALLGDYKTANLYFNRSFSTVSQPYGVWFEVVGAQGTPNFLTGAGGFLQVPSFYSGLHINDTSLSLSAGPALPEAATYIKLRGVSYLGSRVDITWDSKTITISLQAPPAGSAVRSQRGQVLLTGDYRVKAQELVVQDAFGNVFPLVAGGAEVSIPIVGPPADADQRVAIRRA